MLSEDKEFLIEFNAGGISPQALHSITLQTIKRSHGLVFRRLYFKQRLKSAIFLMCRVRLSTSTEPTLTREARKTLLHDGGLSTKCHYYFICIFLLCTYTIFEQIAAPPCHPTPPNPVTNKRLFHINNSFCMPELPCLNQNIFFGV